MQMASILRAWILILSSAQMNAGECAHDTKSFRCVEYKKNYDGDTVTIDIPGIHPLLGKNISVRLVGIDTPEIKTKNPCEKQAARTTQRLVESLLKNAKRIDLENVERDKYFRILADVKADGKSINEILIKNGLAVAYHGGTKKRVDWCAIAESHKSKTLN